MILYRTYQRDADVKPVDGRGGDGGSDFEVLQGGRRRIFQLKYYPDGFPSSSFKNRRSSISKSFARAMKNPLFEWILVVPCNLTPSEHDFVQNLAGNSGVRIRVMGRAALDSMLASFPDLHAYASRSPSADATKTFIESTRVS
ncbi:hypothetical protein ACFVUN_17690 [Kitasatospora griseola]|uniref:hypothetical protein n=1 Tax=Kitasatospora griseola TaxID=2064 RepID=UPI0036D95B2A